MSGSAQVDAYIAKSADFARPILEHLRALVHRVLPDAEEAIKWGMPHFMVSGKNVAGMAAFKAHCALTVHGDERSGEGMGSLGRITGLGDLPPEPEIEARLVSALERIRQSGSATKRDADRKPKPEIAMPEDFAQRLSSNVSAQSHWDSFSPSGRREYLEWITEAKAEATRERRMTQALEWIAEGKHRNWKYQRR